MQPCCESHTKAGTLLEQPRDPQRPEVVVRLCPDCSRRHIEVTLEPGILGLRGGSL